MKSQRIEIDRVTATAFVATILLAVLTVLIYYVPAFHFVYLDPGLGNVMESLSILIVLGAFYLCYARFIVTNELRLLLLAVSFLLLGLYNMVHAVLVPVMGSLWDVTPEQLAYFWLTARLTSGTLLLASLWAGSRKISPTRGGIGLGIAIAGLTVLTLLFFSAGVTDLPSLISPEGWTLVPHGDPSDIFMELTTLGGLYQLLVAATFLVAGVGYLRLYRRERRPFWGWLSISFIVVFFAQINYMIYPSFFTDYVASGDFMRLLSRVILFVGTYAEVTYSFRESQMKNQELQALQDISALGMKNRNVGTILSGIIDTVRDVFDTQTVVMLFPEGDPVRMAARSPAAGLTDDQIAGMVVPLSEDCLVVQSYNDGVTFVSNDPADRQVPGALKEQITIRNAIIAPLQASSGTKGLLMVMNRMKGSFGHEEARFLTIIGARAGMVIENARLHEQLEASAVIEERTRLAREIHDGLAQNLGYLNLMLPQVIGHVQNDAGKALEELGTMRKVVQESLTEARQAIVDLQTPVSDRNFVQDITDYAREFARSSGLDIEVVAADGRVNLKPYARAELVRIVQEALNNVRRHAGAGKVRIVFGGGNGSLRLEVIDNGTGFEPEEILTQDGRRTFGLHSMKGRAEHLGGSLTISSRPGEGTAIMVEVPLQEDDR